jgi:hypothetical protein
VIYNFFSNFNRFRLWFYWVSTGFWGEPTSFTRKLVVWVWGFGIERLTALPNRDNSCGTGIGEDWVAIEYSEEEARSHLHFCARCGGWHPRGELHFCVPTTEFLSARGSGRVVYEELPVLSRRRSEFTISDEPEESEQPVVGSGEDRATSKKRAKSKKRGA